MQLEMTTPYTTSDDAIESRLGDETVILHLGSGIYFGLDPVGTLVWEGLKTPASPQAVCASVRAAFPDAPETVEQDVTGFLDKLLTHELIRPA